jgi:hypothetical protein
MASQRLGGRRFEVIRHGWRTPRPTAETEHKNAFGLGGRTVRIRSVA